ncbi:MAG: hypothetical protein V3V95_08775 [Thermodesulfobacteriota bacterium]
MRNQKIFIIFSAVIALIFISSGWLYATRRVVYDTNIEERAGCAIIRVAFNFPVRYRRHFPIEPHDELRIQFEPLAIGSSDRERENPFEREQVWFSQDDRIPIEEIILETNVAGGPLLTITFQRSVSFDVEQGKDFRSVVIIPFQDTEKATCFPAD